MGHGIWPRLPADGAEGDVIIETLTDKQKLTLVLTVRELSPFRLPEGWEWVRGEGRLLVHGAASGPYRHGGDNVLPVGDASAVSKLS